MLEFHPDMNCENSSDLQNSKLPLHSTDVLLISFWGLLALISLVLSFRIPLWWLIFLADLAACALVYAIARTERSSGSRVLRWVHDWQAFPLVVFTYKQIYFLIGPIHNGRDYDRLLIAADRWLFGADPTVWLARFSTPWLTEALQIAYSLFYVFFIAVGLELYQKNSLRLFRQFSFAIVYGFFISYLGYFFLPAIGPRFTLHDFSQINADLPGLFLTPVLRRFLDFFESIPPGVANSIAMAKAQRDVFPSGHVMMTLVSVALAFKYKAKIRYLVLVLGMLLIFATVYLRYHYVIDILAGAFLAFPCLLTANRYRKRLAQWFF